MNLLASIRKILIVVLAIGLPVFIYFAFIEDDPVFEPEYDVEIGRQTVASIEQDTVEYPLLSSKDYPEAYAYMQNMVNKIVNTPEIQYADIFKYDSVQIIHRDDVLNAFCTPGGYVYVYTGLIQYLDNADDLAGVLGHEIAHAELRHSAVQIQKEFGKNKIMDFLLLGGAGLSGLIKAQILDKMVSLDYSRGQEADADRHSVTYLKDTDYACNGAAAFFAKLIDRGEDVNIPAFLSDHPDSKSRVADINKKAEEYQCDTALMEDSGWEAFKELLPKPAHEEEDMNEDTDAASGAEAGEIMEEETDQAGEGEQE